MRKLLLAAAATLALAAPAAATRVKFTLGGIYDVSWTLPLSPVPDHVAGSDLFVIYNVAFVRGNGTIFNDEIAFVRSSTTSDSSINLGNISVLGPAVFTGPSSAPTFKLGSFAMTDINLDPAPLTIAAVPEPASWAMLVAGFGLAGAVQRRRRRVAA